AALAAAPNTKPAAIQRPKKTSSSSAIGRPTSATVRYWRFRNALAPSAIAPEISTARPSVAGAERTLAYSHTAKPSATTAARKAKAMVIGTVSRRGPRADGGRRARTVMASGRLRPPRRDRSAGLGVDEAAIAKREDVAQLACDGGSDHRPRSVGLI